MREKLTASLIAKLQVPEGKKLFKIHDTEVRGLCVRVIASGLASCLSSLFQKQKGRPEPALSCFIDYSSVVNEGL